MCLDERDIKISGFSRWRGCDTDFFFPLAAIPVRVSVSIDRRPKDEKKKEGKKKRDLYDEREFKFPKTTHTKSVHLIDEALYKFPKPPLINKTSGLQPDLDLAVGTSDITCERGLYQRHVTDNYSCHF